jgi:hypothetical protein
VLRSLALFGPQRLDGEVRHLVARRGGRVIEAGYDERGAARLLVEIAEEEAPALADDVLRVTRGEWSAADSAAQDGSRLR